MSGSSEAVNEMCKVHITYVYVVIRFTCPPLCADKIPCVKVNFRAPVHVIKAYDSTYNYSFMVSALLYRVMSLQAWSKSHWAFVIRRLG